jgi:hypothetical protein
VRTERETAGPSTTLRSGRDDNSVAPLTAIRLTAFGAISLQQNCHPACPAVAVGPERTRISCYAAPTSGNVCGFQ